MIAALALAFRILTIFSAPGEDLHASSRETRWAVAAFPIVGAIVGSIAGAVYVVASHFWPVPSPAPAALTLLASLLVTAGRGPAAVARVADGLASIGADGDRAKALALMSDQRRGASGIVAVAAVLIVKFALLASLGRADGWSAIVAASALGGWANAMGYAAFAPARTYDAPDGGRNAEPGINEFMLATVFAIVAAAIRPIVGLGAFLLAAVVVAPVAQSIARSFGGRTAYLGTALGEVGEIVALVVLSVHFDV